LRNFHQTVPTLSPQSISKSETEDKDEQQLHQPSVEEENQEDKKINVGQPQTLAKIYTSLGGFHNLNIKCQQGGNGQYFEIYIVILGGVLIGMHIVVHLFSPNYLVQRSTNCPKSTCRKRRTSLLKPWIC
jgi:hypothetical protein